MVCSRNVAVLCHVLSFPSQLPSINKSYCHVLKASQNCLIYTGSHCQSPSLNLNHISPELLPWIWNRLSCTLSHGRLHTPSPPGVVQNPHCSVNPPPWCEHPHCGVNPLLWCEHPHANNVDVELGRGADLCHW